MALDPIQDTISYAVRIAIGAIIAGAVVLAIALSLTGCAVRSQYVVAGHAADGCYLLVGYTHCMHSYPMSECYEPGLCGGEVVVLAAPERAPAIVWKSYGTVSYEESHALGHDHSHKNRLHAEAKKK